MRFDEFVAWTDSAGFGPGTCSRRYVDWVRIIGSSRGLLVIALVSGAIVSANLI